MAKRQSKPKEDPMDLVDIYNRAGAVIVGVGEVGPDKPAKVRRYLADELVKNVPNDWSFQPFTFEDVTNE